MAMSDARWAAIAPSQYPWEHEALDFVRQRLPDYEPYRAWSNFEFVADDGRIYEVDLLVVSPKGAFLIEIKSRPGVLEGDLHTWTWTTDGRRVTDDNPLLLANRKAKRLKSLVARQRAAQKSRVPFIVPLVFCSATDLTLRLDPAAREGVFTRDRDATADQPAVPGIVAAITRWTPGAPDDPGDRRIDKPVAKALARALDEAGIRPSQRARRVGDYVLGPLLAEGPSYQDWAAEHCAVKGVDRRVRLFPTALGASTAQRELLRRAAEREFRVLQGVTHPGILRAEAFVMHERGPALVFDYDPKAVRLDHFLRERGASVAVDLRIHLLRQIAEVLRYAHEKRIVHRALSPQCIFVADAGTPRPRVQIFNWQTAARDAATSSGAVTATAHPEQLIEDAALVYVAPEVIAGTSAAGEYADVFSLGAIAFHLFAGRSPATSILQRDAALRASRGLDLAAASDGVGKALRDLVLLSTCPDVANRLDTVDDFLELVEGVEEELTAPAEEPLLDPTEATAKDRLPGGFAVQKRLGRGSCAVTLLVERNAVESVLKVAATPEHNERLRNEAEVLFKLRHERIVELREVVELGDRVAIVMARAGEQTLAQRLRSDGRLHVELLERFGDELLQVVGFLEEQGIAHRDIKPDNIGLSVGTARDRLHLVLFDFSLARTPTDNIRAGTRPYLDPFLALRRPPRWDVQAERFAAAMTLYEMATATLPRWGDGQSDPALIDDEVALDTDLFDADLRAPLAEFFGRALRRDVRERFDTVEDMVRAWRRIFEAPQHRPRLDTAATVAALEAAMSSVGPETQLALLPLSARVLSALDRLNLVTAEDLLQVPVMRLYGMRGVGNKTRREIRDLVGALAKHLPATEAIRGVGGAGVVAEPETEPYGAERASVDLLVNRLLPLRGRVPGNEEKVLRLLVGLDELPTPAPMGWPSQTDVAAAAGVTRARVGQMITKARQRWSKNPTCTSLREDIVGLLDTSGGVMTVAELASAVLSTRGSALREPTRSQAAMAVTRAAVEAERGMIEPRYAVSRSGECVVVARTLELADYAERLGRAADQLVTEDPLPSAARVLEALHGLRAPAGIVIEAGRLVALAAAAAQTAAASARLELYPRGMAAARAVKLACGALVGAHQLTVDEVRERVRNRYPEVAEIPGRPRLDDLLRDAGWDVVWIPDAARGRGAYRPRLPVVGQVTSGSDSLSRHASDAAGAASPELSTAQEFRTRLKGALERSAFLALTVRPRELRLADRALAEQFPLERVSLEALLIEAMRAEAAAKNVDWNRVLMADAAAPESRDWTNLKRLVAGAIGRVEERLHAAQRPLLLTYPGLLARYDRLDVIERLRDLAGRRDGLPGVWLLVASDDQQALPTIDGRAVPVITPGEWARIPDQWLQHPRGLDAM